MNIPHKFWGTRKYIDSSGAIQKNQEAAISSGRGKPALNGNGWLDQ